MAYSSLLLSSLTLGAAYIVYTIIYRLYFHPLAKYPGPLWARISTIPSWWYTMKQDRHIWFWRLQQEYGPTFRYRPDAVLINTPTAYRTIFGPKGNVKKSDYYRVWAKTADVESTWSVTDVSRHGRKRRVLNQAFSDAALRSVEPLVHSNTDRWLDLIEENAANTGRLLNMAHEINYLVFDILGDLCFGRSFDMKEPLSDKRYIPEVLATFLALLHPICFSPFAEWWVWAKPRGLDRVLGLVSPPAVTKWEKFVNSCLQERTAVEEKLQRSGEPAADARKDFFHYLFNAKDPETGEGYSLSELYGECQLLIIAGSDTTSIVMSAMMFYMARNRDVQAKLANEILSSFSSFDDIRGGPILHSCKYLKAFIQEACRMNAPVPAELARQVLPSGTWVDGQYFPEGTKLSMSSYCLSYSPDVYASPLEFRPERWIVADANAEDGVSAESLALAESGFCAFSTGSRGCVGKNLAWLEMMIVVAKLVYRFELEQDPQSNLGGGDPSWPKGRTEAGQYQIYDAFIGLRDGPMVTFRARSRQ